LNRIIRMSHLPNWKWTLRRFAQRAYTGKLICGVERILKACEDDLTDPTWISGVIRQIGLRYDRRGIYGSDARFMNFLGPGLWQIPGQFTGALLKLASLRPASLLEIGTCDGWTFSVMAAYLSRFHSGFQALTIDPIDQFLARNRVQKLLPIQFRKTTSDTLVGSKFDLCFIDGDHSSEWVGRDFDQVGRFARICMFHDINDPLAGGGAVQDFWLQLRFRFPDRQYWEFTDHQDNFAVMGIGIFQR